MKTLNKNDLCTHENNELALGMGWSQTVTKKDHLGK